MLNRTIAAAALATGVIAAACGGGGATTAPTGAPATAPSGAPTSAPASGSVSGEIYVSGSSTVQPISLAVSEAFQAANPDFGYNVEGPGTGDGFALFCDGTTDVADASRAIKDEEEQTCSEAGISYTELKVGYDGITVMTHPDTPIECLATADLYALLGPESDAISTWQDAGALAAEIGSTTAFPSDLNLQIVAPGEESGTYDAFIELAGIADTAADRGAVGEGEDVFLRVPGPNYTASPSDNVIVEGVESGAGSLGFVGFAYFEEAVAAGSPVKAISVDAGDGCIAPTIETIADGSYPLSRPLFIYPNNGKADENPAVQAWVDYFLSDEGVAKVTEVGYVALPAEELQATRDAWANR